MTDKTREEFIAWAKKYNPKNWTSALWAWKYQQNIIDALRVENARLRQQLKDAERDAREDQWEAATEAMWSERQGEDYGSY